MTKAKDSSLFCMQSRLQRISSRRLMALRAAGALTPYPRPVRKPLRTSAACQESIPDCRSSLRRFNNSRAENFSILAFADIAIFLSHHWYFEAQAPFTALPSTVARNNLREEPISIQGTNRSRASDLRQKLTSSVSSILINPQRHHFVALTLLLPCAYTATPTLHCRWRSALLMRECPAGCIGRWNHFSEDPGTSIARIHTTHRYGKACPNLVSLSSFSSYELID